LNDLTEWAGSRIFGRGKNYHLEGRVSDLAKTEEGALIAWVDGSERYMTKVILDEEGIPNSICTCPYEIDCKHGVAVVLEYLARVERNRRVPKAKKNDTRLGLFDEEDWDDEFDDNDDHALAEDGKKEIDTFLKSKTKARLIELIKELAEQYPEIARDLADRKHLSSGDTKALVTRLRREIQEIGDEPGWQNYWQGEGFTPDYSGIRNKLETLLKAGFADDVVTLGDELVNVGIRHVEESHDEGETAMEVSECMPLIVKALEQSSLTPAYKLAWAVNAVLKDPYETCEAMAEYLYKRHSKESWHALADHLLEKLKTLKSSKSEGDFDRNYARDRLSNWAIHALERAGRSGEIIPHCEAEAIRTGSYDRLVKPKAYKDAAIYLRKAAKIMLEQKQQEEWNQYMQEMRTKHARKRKLMEILDGLEGKHIHKSPHL